MCWFNQGKITVAIRIKKSKLRRLGRGTECLLWPCRVTAPAEWVCQLKLAQTTQSATRIVLFFAGWTSYWLRRGFVAVPVWRGIWRPFAKHGVPPRLQWRLSPWWYGEGFQKAAPGLMRPALCDGVHVLPHFALIHSQAMKMSHVEMAILFYFFYYHGKIYYLFLIKTAWFFFFFFKLLVQTVAELYQWCRLQTQLAVPGGHVLLWAPHRTVTKCINAWEALPILK